MDSLAMRRVGGANIVVVEGDVTRQQVRAVVNAANETLQHKEGVATAIVRTGGRVIQEESDSWVRRHGPVEPGNAAVTTGGMLHASHVIHVVGPYGDADNAASVLAAAVASALDAARDHELESVAIPAISTGKRGYPPEDAARVLVGAVAAWLAANPGTMTEVRLVGYTSDIAESFAAALNDVA
jgi:O-acetyl-ADP-ribose deacetylase (regulator of RNase III)